MHLEIWWIWMGIAALLLIGEIFTAGFFLIFFSIGAAAAGVLAMLDIGYSAQLIIFVLTSGILFVFGRRFAERVTEKQPPGIGADRFIGTVGTVLEEINNTANTGKIRIVQDIWRAGSEDGGIIEAGLTAKVIRIDGTRAFVRIAEKENQ